MTPLTRDRIESLGAGPEMDRTFEAYILGENDVCRTRGLAYVSIAASHRAANGSIARESVTWTADGQSSRVAAAARSSESGRSTSRGTSTTIAARNARVSRPVSIQSKSSTARRITSALVATTAPTTERAGIAPCGRSTTARSRRALSSTTRTRSRQTTELRISSLKSGASTRPSTTGSHDPRRTAYSRAADVIGQWRGSCVKCVAAKTASAPRPAQIATARAIQTVRTRAATSDSRLLHPQPSRAALLSRLS